MAGAPSSRMEWRRQLAGRMRLAWAGLGRGPMVSHSLNFQFRVGSRGMQSPCFTPRSAPQVWFRVARLQICASELFGKGGLITERVGLSTGPSWTPPPMPPCMKTPAQFSAEAQCPATILPPYSRPSTLPPRTSNGHIKELILHLQRGKRGALGWSVSSPKHPLRTSPRAYSQGSAEKCGEAEWCYSSAFRELSSKGVQIDKGNSNL